MALKGEQGSGGEGDNGPFPKVEGDTLRTKQGQTRTGIIGVLAAGGGMPLKSSTQLATDAIIRFLELRAEN